MTRRAYGHAMLALLGLGAADLAALNFWAIPGLGGPTASTASTASLTLTTDLSSATDAPPKAANTPPVAKAPARPQMPQPEPPVTPAAAAPQPPQPIAAVTPTPAPTTPPETPSAQIDASTGSQTLLFSRGAWWIGPSKRKVLFEALRRLGPNSIIEVDGHADSMGPNDVNQRISERRAAAVVEVLTRAGVQPSRIRKRAYGETQPTGTGRDRRVEIIVRGEP